jgi:hypothetical protein
VLRLSEGMISVLASYGKTGGVHDRWILGGETRLQQDGDQQGL